jgi:hypothetical protein
MILLRVLDPFAGANNIPANAPAATPASNPNTNFPELIILIFFLFVDIFN